MTNAKKSTPPVEYRHTNHTLQNIPRPGTPEWRTWVQEANEVYDENQAKVPREELEDVPFVFIDGYLENDPLDPGTVRTAMRFLYLHRPSFTFWGAYADPITGLVDVGPLPRILPGGVSCFSLWPKRGEKIRKEDTATLKDLRELAAAYKEADDARRGPAGRLSVIEGGKS